jgi:hypothetical protein
LSYNSASFRYLLRDEANQNIGLLTEDPSIFDIIVYWMYTARFWSPNADKDGKIPLDYATLVRIYLFAARKGMNNLQIAAMKLIYQKNDNEVRPVPGLPIENPGGDIASGEIGKSLDPDCVKPEPEPVPVPVDDPWGAFYQLMNLDPASNHVYIVPPPAPKEVQLLRLLQSLQTL